VENKVLNKLPAPETKTIERYYLDGEEITQSDYKAIKKFIKRCCSSCSQAKTQEENPYLRQYSGSGSYYS
jgi:hypothetical protein